MNTAYPIPYTRKVQKPVRNSVQENNGVTFLFSNNLNWQERVHASRFLHNDTPKTWVYVVNAGAFRMGKSVDGNVFGFVRTPRDGDDYFRVPYFVRPSSLGGFSHDKRRFGRVVDQMYLFEDSAVLWHDNQPYHFHVDDMTDDEWVSLWYEALLNYRIETSTVDPKHESDRDFCEDFGIDRRQRFLNAY